MYCGPKNSGAGSCGGSGFTGHDVLSAWAVGIHINSWMVLGKCCRGFSMTSSAVDILSSASRSRS